MVPAVTPLSWSVTSFDTSQQRVETSLSLRISDNLSGVREVNLTLVGPTHRNLRFAPDGGLGLSGVVSVPVDFPEKSPAGNWTLRFLSVVDGAGNFTIIEHEGVPVGVRTLTQTGAGDLNEPAWVSVSSSVASVDARTQDVSFVVEAVATDDLGIESAQVHLRSPIAGGYVGPFTLSSDGGVWSGEVTLPRGAAAGTWTVAPGRLEDLAGRTVSSSSPMPLAPFVQAGPGGDSAPPSLGAGSASPAVVAAAASDAQVVLTFAATDDLAGVERISLKVYPPRFLPGGFGPAPLSVELTPSSGNALDGGWSGTLVVPRYAMVGFWSVGEAQVRDRAGNGRVISPPSSVTRFEVR